LDLAGARRKLELGRNMYMLRVTQTSNIPVHERYTCQSLKTFLLRDAENKSNTSTPSIVNNQKTSVPLSVSSFAGGDGPMGAWIAVTGYQGVVGKNRRYSTVSHFTKAEGCLRQPDCFHLKSIFLWNSKTWFTTHSPRSLATRSTLRIAKHMSTHRLWRYKQLYISTTSQKTQTTPQSSAHRKSWPRRSDNRVREGELQDADDGPIYGSSSPGRRTGGAGRPN